MHYYLIKSDGSQAGPYSMDQLKTFWGNGTINLETLYWTQGMPEWQPIRTIENLLRPLPTTRFDVPAEPPELATTPFAPSRQKGSHGKWIVFGIVLLAIGLGFAFLHGIIGPQAKSPSPAVIATPTPASVQSEDKTALANFLNTNPDSLPFEVQVTGEHVNALDETGKQISLKQGETIRILSYSSDILRALSSDNKVITVPMGCTNIMEVAQNLSQQTESDTLVDHWSGTLSSHCESKNEYFGAGHFFVKMTDTLTINLMPDKTFTLEMDGTTQSNTIDIRTINNDVTKSRGKGEWSLTNSTTLNCVASSFETFKNGQWVTDPYFKGSDSENYQLVVAGATVQQIKSSIPVFNPQVYLDDKDLSASTITGSLILTRQDNSAITLSNQSLRHDISRFYELLRQLAAATRVTPSPKNYYNPTKEQIEDTFKTLDWGAYRQEADSTLTRIKAILDGGSEKVPTALEQRGEFFLSYEEQMLLQKIQKNADEGQPKFQNLLGIIYTLGIGTPKDMAKALMYFQQAAEQNDSHAEVNLGTLYENGTGVDRDYSQALNWFIKAADNGEPTAENRLGFMYQNGWGIQKDYSQALNWFQKAAAQGYPHAQANLGYMYQNSLGVPQNYTQALNWYQKAADQGNLLAETNLGCLYFDGHGTPQDYSKAFYWFQKAADQGDPDAESNLGVMYKYGKGVAADSDLALKWFRKAADHGNKIAKMTIEQMNNTSETASQ